MFKMRDGHLLPATLLALSLPFAAPPISAHESAAGVSVPQVTAATRHASSGEFQRTGLMTTVAFGPDGETTVKTIAIDVRRYVESRGSVIAPVAMPAGVLATPESVAAMGACTPWDLSIGCGSTTQPGTGPNDPTHPGGVPPNINPGGGGPGAPAPQIPGPPLPNSVPCSVGVATLVQFYDAGKWQQTTTYNRPVYGDGSDCSDGPWGEPVINQKPVKN